MSNNTPQRAAATTTPAKRGGTMDYPLTGAQQAQLQQQAAQAANPLSSPISIAPRSSPRAPITSSSGQVTHMAQSCPTFSWQPPPAPSARPRLASVDPPNLELPPSPPVFSPVQAEAVKSKKEDPKALQKQIYSRSLSNYSSSAPTHVDYLSKFHPNLGQLDEAGVGDDSDEEEEQQSHTSYKPSARAMQAQQRQQPNDLDDEPLDAQTGRVGISGAPATGIAMKSASIAHGNRVQSVQRNDDFSLSKSPTIFSIMSTSTQGHGPLGLHTANTSTSSSGSGSSPGHSILGAIAAGQSTGSATAKRPVQSGTSVSPDAARQLDAGDDDLQFSISLTDEQEGEADDSGKQSDFSLY